MKKTRFKISLSAILASCLLLTACAENKADNITSENSSNLQSQEIVSSDSNSDINSSNESKTDEKEENKDETPPENAEFIPNNAKAEASVILSNNSGIYPEKFDLTLSSEQNGDIYYTLDGSDPTTSKNAIKYQSPISISDRSNDKNIVRGVDPVLFSGNYNIINKTRDGFTCAYSAPSDKDVDKCTVVRAAVKSEDGTFLGETSATYFIGTPEEHIEGIKESCEASGTPLAVISISMNYEDLFDSKTGIYVKGEKFDDALKEFLAKEKLRDPETARSLDANYKQRGRLWERYAAINVLEFDANGTNEVISQNCGIRIQGNYSRSDLQKAFRIYARGDYGKKNFKYAFFGDEYKNDNGEVMDKYKSLTLRAGGNCAFTAKFNDTYWQSLTSDMNVETKHSRPCVLYINGEYFGLYVLEEDYSDDYFEAVHGVKKSDVVVYKGDAEALKLGYKLDEGKLPDTVTDEKYYFNDLLSFFKSHKNLKSDNDYNEFIKLVDPESVKDYFAIESWINNKWDWPGKNWSMWKTIAVDENNPFADGRWRFMLYDVEFGGVSGEGDARTNTIKEDNYKPNGLLDMSTNNPAVLCFAYLMTNEAFRNDFYSRLNYLTENNFEKNKATAKLEEFVSIYSPLYEQFFNSYPGVNTAEDAVNGGYASAKCIKDFVAKRSKYIQKMIDYCEKTL